MEADGLGFGTAQKKGPKSGRRAAQATNNPAPNLDEEVLATETSNKKKPSDGPPGRPNKAVSGWGEDAPARKPRARQLGEGFETVEDDRFNKKNSDKDDDSESDIPIIPELEENVEEDFTSKVALAPNVAVNRVATYRELDTDLLKQAAFLTLDNEIDLKLLTKTLSPSEDIIEDDKEWTWDKLFTEVSSELRLEWEKKETENEEKTEVEP
ncbi:intraflagellar transport protein 43 homolog A-like [Physella acuta]|uniref:intraflagellar transport protein 43 homolog A-like n=1 Tax=Physella acuta TaxID=109671 RepID=UPI0027DE4D7F|nr:intraflagellar transport protein 43 homolog A-like [Physella acuta]